MRIRAAPDGALERLGLLLNRVPVPVGEAMFGMPVSRALQVAQRTGMLEALAERPHDAAGLARRLGLREQPTRLLLDVVASLGHLERRDDGAYELTARSRRWLDPDSEAYVGSFIADSANWWAWWEGLEGLVRDGDHVDIHQRPDDDPLWSTYIRGQHELARLSSDAVARAVHLPAGAASLLDVAGGHGEYSMALCRRHAGLRALVVDLPGSARVGREIVAAAGMADRVTHREGDMFTAGLGGPHDGALCFNIVHHLGPEDARRLFARVREALRPGAPLCVLDLFERPGQDPDTTSILALFFHLTSGARIHTADDVSAWLAEAGFGRARRRTFAALPGLAMVRAQAA